ncbi:MAG: hypothetical protein Q8L41_05265 [Anaerolineales bacterium]|nr:hypothetical protein [Anaerolineales bacterium]
MGEEAVKLLEKMRVSKAGWTRNDLDRLYTGFGFIIKSGRGPHDKVYHPDYPFLITFVPRHRKLLEVYVSQAIKLIDRLKELQESQHGQDPASKSS